MRYGSQSPPDRRGQPAELKIDRAWSGTAIVLSPHLQPWDRGHRRSRTARRCHATRLDCYGVALTHRSDPTTIRGLPATVDKQGRRQVRSRDAIRSAGRTAQSLPLLAAMVQVVRRHRQYDHGRGHHHLERGAAAIFGYTPQERSGRARWCYTPRTGSASSSQSLIRYGEAGGPPLYETKRMRKDGTIMDVLSSLRRPW